MELLLGQLVYTRFAGVGLTTVSSRCVPQEIEKAFRSRIVSRHWDILNPPDFGYRATYIHQINSAHTLFGWLYHDGQDKNGIDIPYFICYYLKEKLLHFQLETIFHCLHQGPLELIDRYKLPTFLETKIVADLWSYQPTRPGIVIPVTIRQRSRNALQRGESLNLFVTQAQQETVIKFNERSSEQQLPRLSIYKRYIIEGLNYTPPEEDIALITNEILAPPSPQKLTFSLNKAAGIHPAPTYRMRRNYLQNRPINSVAQARRNIQLILWIIVATIAVTSLGYRLMQVNLPVLSNPEVNATTTTFYQSLAAVPHVPQGLFNYSGSITFAPLRSPTILTAINQSQRQFQLRFIEPIDNEFGSTTVIKMLIAGELSFAQSSRALTDTETAQARARGLLLEQIPVAIDAIVFYVNPQVSVVGLSTSQLQDIFIGKVRNWKALGGPDREIVPISLNPQTTGTANFVQQNVLLGNNFGKNVQQVKTVTESILKVSQNPGAIGYGSASLVRNQKTVYPLPLAKAPGRIYVSPFVSNNIVLNKNAIVNGSYPLTRRLFVIIKRDGRLDEQAGQAYVNLILSNEGQMLVEQAGFLSIR